MTKSNKGITLIALVITIIVLLILAGVSIAMLTGSNGVLTKASESQVMNKRGEVSERINLALNAVMTDILSESTTSNNNKIDLDNYNEAIIKEENDINSTEYSIAKSAALPTEGKKRIIIIKWDPHTFDESSKYGASQTDDIWGAIAYDTEKTSSTSHQIPYTISDFANSAMGKGNETKEKPDSEVS